MATPDICSACGLPPLPSAGRMIAAALAVGAGYALLLWWLQSQEDRAWNAALAKWRATLLAAVKAGAMSPGQAFDEERNGLPPTGCCPVDVMPEVPTADLTPKGGRS